MTKPTIRSIDFGPAGEEPARPARLPCTAAITPAPTRIAKKITDSVAPFAIAPIGLSGMISMNRRAGSCGSATARGTASAKLAPTPGAISVATSRPVLTASAVVRTYMPSVLIPMLPSRFGSASAATPDAMVRKTSGTTSMRISRTNNSPIQPIAVAPSPPEHTRPRAEDERGEDAFPQRDAEPRPEHPAERAGRRERGGSGCVGHDILIRGHASETLADRGVELAAAIAVEIADIAIGLIRQRRELVEQVAHPDAEARILEQALVGLIPDIDAVRGEVLDAEARAVGERRRCVADRPDIAGEPARAPALVTPAEAGRPAPFRAAVLFDQVLGADDDDRRIDVARCLTVDQRLLQTRPVTGRIRSSRAGIQAQVELADAGIANLIIEGRNRCRGPCAG